MCHGLADVLIRLPDTCTHFKADDKTANGFLLLPCCMYGTHTGVLCIAQHIVTLDRHGGCGVEDTCRSVLRSNGYHVATLPDIRQTVGDVEIQLIGTRCYFYTIYVYQTLWSGCRYSLIQFLQTWVVVVFAFIENYLHLLEWYIC